MSWGAKGATRQLKLYPDPEVKAKPEVRADTSRTRGDDAHPSFAHRSFSRPEKHCSPSAAAHHAPRPRGLPTSQTKASGDFERLQTVSAVQWNSFRDTEVKRLLRPGIADGANALAENMTKASAISVNLVPLSAEVGKPPAAFDRRQRHHFGDRAAQQARHHANILCLARHARGSLRHPQARAYARR